MVDVIYIPYTGPSDSFYYIRLGALLEYIQNHIMYFVETDGNSIPMLNFDIDVYTNLMYVDSNQISIDPNICVVNKLLVLSDDKGNDKIYNFTPNNQNAEDFISPIFLQNGYECYGQIMNIYVHMKYILLELDRLKDAKTGKVVLIDFLNSILSSIGIALGGINNLEATIDETSNTVIIRDTNPLPNIEDVVIPTLNTYFKNKNIDKYINDGYSTFDLYSYKTENNVSHASFIKDFSFTTEISPQLSTMLTVGATADSTVVGENSTAFSKFNSGLKDRFKKKITQGPKVNLEDIEKKWEDLSSKYGEAYNNYIEYIRNLSQDRGFKFDSENSNEYKNSLINFNTYLQQAQQAKLEYLKATQSDPNIPDNKKQAIKDKLSKYESLYIPNTGFIPFNMSITMDGLSGMKIYNKFYIDTEFLPSNYPKYAEFLIKNITHKIENNKWTTNLESIVTVKGKEDKSKSKNINPSPSPAPKKTSPTTTSTGNRNNCTIKNIPTGKKLVSYNDINTYLKSKGYSKAAIAGIISNIQSESGLNLNAFNSEGGGCGAYGLAQWRNTRQTDLYNYAQAINQPVDSATAQLGYLAKELNEGVVGPKIKGLTNPSEAAYIVASEFEKFKNASNKSNPEVIRRQTLANNIYKKLA